MLQPVESVVESEGGGGGGREICYNSGFKKILLHSYLWVVRLLKN